MHSGATPLAAKRRWVVWHATVGLGFGFAVLHPISMFIVRLFEPGVRSTQTGPVTVVDTLKAMARAFEAEMVPMGLVFGVFTAGLGAVNGWYRVTAAIQRNQLARQLDLTRRYRSELEELVQQLWGQNARLAQLEQAKRRTTQFMVHDFKTHLGCIMGYSELLLKRAQGRWAPEEIDALTRIRRQGARMTAAVTDMLEFARLREAGAPRKESVSAEELLRQVSEDVSLPDDR